MFDKQKNKTAQIKKVMRWPVNTAARFLQINEIDNNPRRKALTRLSHQQKQNGLQIFKVAAFMQQKHIQGLYSYRRKYNQIDCKFFRF